MDELHNSLDENEIKKRILDCKKIYPKLKLFHSTSNVSLLMRLKQDHLFELCDELGDTLELCPHENFSENTQNVENDHSEISHAENVFSLGEDRGKFLKNLRKNSTSHPLYFEENFMEILERNAYFYPNEEITQYFRPTEGMVQITNATYFKIIQKTLKTLSKFPILVEFLKLLAAYNHKKVIYDFSSSRQVPCQDNKKYLNRNELILCCKDLLEFPIEIISGEMSIEDYKIFSRILPKSCMQYSTDEVKLTKCYASIAHELCHWTLQFTYENFCKPYAKKDELIRSFKFQSMFSNSKFVTFLHGNIENTIKISTAEDASKIIEKFVETPSEFHKNFPKVLRYFEVDILTDVRNVSRYTLYTKEIKICNEKTGVQGMIQKRNFHIKNEFLTNAKIDVYRDAENFIQVIRSNCPILVLTAILQIDSIREKARDFLNAPVKFPSWNIIKINFEKNHVNQEFFLLFIQESQLFNEENERFFEVFQNIYNSILVIFCNEFEKLQDIQAKLKISSRIVFVTDHIDDLPKFYKVSTLDFDLNSLTDDSLERLKQKTIDYFGEERKVQEVFNEKEFSENFELLVNEEKVRIDLSPSEIQKTLDGDQNLFQKLVRLKINVKILKLYCEQILKNYSRDEVQKIFRSNFLTRENFLIEAIHSENVKAFNFIVKFYEKKNLQNLDYYAKSLIYSIAGKDQSSAIVGEVIKVLRSRLTKEEIEKLKSSMLESKYANFSVTSEVKEILKEL